MAIVRPSRVSTPVDLALAAVLVAAAVAESLNAQDAPHPAIRAALGGLAAASVLLRRTWPTIAAAVLSGAMAVEAWTTESTDEVGVLVACLVVAYSVAAHAPRREALLGGALVVMAVSITIAADPSDSVSNIPPSVLLFVGIPFGLGLAMRRRQQHIAALTLETEALAREADAAVDVERRRIARELHDVVSHAVTLIAVQAEAGQAVLADDPAAARRSLDAIGQVSREALAELTRLLAVLREDESAEEPGLANLAGLVDGVRAAGVQVELDVGQLGDLDLSLDRCVYRVVQEALTNVLRHASAATVRITLARTDDEVRVRVHSEGRAHVSAYGGTGRGLAGLRERVAGLGGTFEGEPLGEGRFQVTAIIPLDPSRPVRAAR
ncbi:MAG: sensor histidine kinase [Nocardioides sp.]